ncbi:hypothetical protein [Maribellus maritimus]|uniref:hypothetical protein n=1 Tax=Maribellus maritimus TaxID=2870838 RepID=UPI001EEADBFB|nr:hypothetical protein [Maribellus maritimus]MCG6188921.1 hypothetical protein [Maribellus maritimus]
MKTKVWLTIALSGLLCLTSLAQEKKNYIWSYEGKKRTNTIGLYGGVSGTYSTVMDNSANWLGYKAGLVFNQHWGIGFAGSALNYDKNLDRLVANGTYRLEAGYSGLFLEYIVPLKDKAKLSFSWTTGMGLAQYVYNKEFKENKLWYEEIIDQERFAANELAAEFMFRLAGNWWLGVQGSYRDTSPVELNETADDIFEQFNVGISIKYGIF